LTASTEKGALIGGALDLVEQLGEYALVHLNTAAGVPFIAKMDEPPEVTKGAQMWFTANPNLVHFFAQESGLRINS
jgi:ABC-type sugar transport system ATPase subunit